VAHFVVVVAGKDLLAQLVVGIDSHFVVAGKDLVEQLAVGIEPVVVDID
jgi:hypothetical protein